MGLKAPAETKYHGPRNLTHDLHEASKPTARIDRQYKAHLLDGARCLVKKLESPDDVVPLLARMVAFLKVETVLKEDKI